MKTILSVFKNVILMFVVSLLEKHFVKKSLPITTQTILEVEKVLVEIFGRENIEAKTNDEKSVQLKSDNAVIFKMQFMGNYWQLETLNKIAKLEFACSTQLILECIAQMFADEIFLEMITETASEATKNEVAFANSYGVPNKDIIH